MAEAEEIEQGAEAPEKPEVKQEAPRPSRADYDRLQAEKASKNGWKDFDDYVAEGGDPEKWKTADAFNTYGELIGTVKRQKAEFDQRLEGVQRLSEAQLAAQRVQLLAERDARIEQGGKDVVKDVRAIEKQISTLEQPIVPRTNAALDNWNAENPWIMEDSPKSAYAKQLFGREVAGGKSVEQAIEAVENGLKKHYPPPSKTATIPESERGNGPKSFTKGPKAATMDSLTAEEAHIWKHSSSMWNNDPKKFLQAVNDIRKGAK